MFSTNEKSIKLELNYKEKSLEIAFKAFLSTYHSNREILVNNQESYSNQYIESCIETILHFQHYFELYIKELLEDVHPILPLRMNNNKKKEVILRYKLLMKEQVDISDYAELNSVEFSDALNIACELLQENIIDSKYHFILKERKILEALNTFRNRILHRGLYLLRYEALDEFICRYLLPLVKISLLSNQSMNFCLPMPISFPDFNIMDEMIRIGKNKVDFNKLAIVKEIGRAAFNLPISFEEESIQRGAILNVYETAYGGYYGAKKETSCPVCGKETLVYFEHYDYSYIKCLCCGFEVNNFIGKIEESKFVYDELVLWDFDNKR